MNLAKLNLIFVSVIVVAAGAFSAGFLFPGMRDLGIEKKKISAELAQAAQMQAQIGDVTTLYEGLMNLRENEQILWSQVPAEPRLGQLLNQLSKCATATGIESPEIQPGMPQDVDPARLPEQLRLAANLTVQPVMVRFEGTFDQLIRLLSSIDEMERLVRVNGLKAVNSEQTPGRLQVEMELHAYHRRGV